MKPEYKEGEDYKFIPMTSIHSGNEMQIGDDIFCYTNQIVNVIMIGKPKEKNWVMVDAGMPKSGKRLIEVAEARFGKNNPPKAILLTHGHFDHVGGLITILEKWNVPVYAHPLEFPFLNGSQSYPSPDSSVAGGFLAKISFIYPVDPIDISPNLQKLPEDNTLPHLPEWTWVHTPGHSPGHVSFFRKKDGMMLVGDAFIAVEQDSLYNVLVQKEGVYGPPVYLTTDWNAAHISVKSLSYLNPNTAVTGHGRVLEGEMLKEGLEKLAHNFKEKAVPKHGKYVADK